MQLPLSPLFRFGLISDVQWAEIPDGLSFHGTPRYYRAALVSARRAVAAFKAARVALAVHLGDIVDFHNLANGSSEMALDAAVEAFDALGAPVLHCIGNHCLYNASRSILNSRLKIDEHKRASSLSGHHSYFSLRPPVPQPGFRIIVLDGYDVSILGWPAGHPLHEQAEAILAERNPNEDKNSNEGLVGRDKRYVKFGGAVSDAQLAWLAAELAACRDMHERAIVCCHLCLHPETCNPTCLLWNYQEVLQMLQGSADVVAATLSGHAHVDGYHCDAYGIHHRVCHGVLETPPGEDCYAIVEVFQDKIVVNGAGTFDSGEWALQPSEKAVLRKGSGWFDGGGEGGKEQEKKREEETESLLSGREGRQKVEAAAAVVVEQLNGLEL